MPLIPEENQSFLRDRFAKDLSREVTITLFTQDEAASVASEPRCLYCQETRELLEEIAGLSDKIRLRVHDLVADREVAQAFGVDKVPAVIIGDGASKGVRYYGLPGGYELSALVEDILEVGQGWTDLSADIKSQLNQIDQDVHIQVFVTPT